MCGWMDWVLVPNLMASSSFRSALPPTPGRWSFHPGVGDSTCPPLQAKDLSKGRACVGLSAHSPDLQRREFQEPSVAMVKVPIRLGRTTLWPVRHVALSRTLSLLNSSCTDVATLMAPTALTTALLSTTIPE